MELRPYQLDLVNNARTALAEGNHAVCCVLGCGGGKSVIQGTIAAMATTRKNYVLFLVHRKELCQQITGTFTACDVDFSRCSVMMVQTACRRLGKLEKPALIIVDECHHALNNSYLKVLKYFPNALVLGFTATPQRLGTGGLGEVFDKLIESVSTKWLIEHHYLAPYHYYGVQLADATKLHTKHGDYDKAEVEELMNRSAIFGSAVENWLKLANGKKTIIYCSSIETSKKTVKAFQDAGVMAAHLDGSTAKAERDMTVSEFRSGKIKVLSNVDLFGEGFDVPDCEAVVLLRPTKSLTLHVQQSMRSMRYDPNNPDKVAIILDHVGNYRLHGLPDDEREWTLEGKAKKKQDEAPIKQCPQCFSVVPKTAQKCPYCGCEFKTQTTEREDKPVVDDVFLKMITWYPKEAYRCAKTFEELRYFQQQRGYNFFWALRTAIQMDIPVPVKYKFQIYKFKLNNGKAVRFK